MKAERACRWAALHAADGDWGQASVAADLARDLLAAARRGLRSKVRRPKT